MKKVFLALTLFVFGCSSDKWTSTLHCEPDPNHVQEIYTIALATDHLTLRINERKQTLRINMYSEMDYEVYVSDLYPDIIDINASFEDIDRTFDLRFILSRMTVFLSEIGKDGSSKENKYNCRIV